MSDGCCFLVHSVGSVASQATLEAHPAELSSAVSTLSPLSSSSGSEPPSTFRYVDVNEGFINVCCD